MKEKTWRNYIFQTLKGSLLRSQLLDLTEIQTHPRFMYILVTFKDEEDQIKKKEARVVTTLYIIYLRCSWSANSIVGGGIWPNSKQFKLNVLVTCKNWEDPFKMRELECHNISTIVGLWGILQTLTGN